MTMIVTVSSEVAYGDAQRLYIEQSVSESVVFVPNPEPRGNSCHGLVNSEPALQIRA